MKNQTHYLRYATKKRGLVAKCGETITDDQWVGSRVKPSCKKCNKK